MPVGNSAAQEGHVLTVSISEDDTKVTLRQPRSAASPMSRPEPDPSPLTDETGGITSTCQIYMEWAESLPAQPVPEPEP